MWTQEGSCGREGGQRQKGDESWGESRQCIMYTRNCQRTNLISKGKNKTTKLNSGIPSVALPAVSKTFCFLPSMVAHACNANTRYADLCDSRPVRATHPPSLLYCFPACLLFFFPFPFLFLFFFFNCLQIWEVQPCSLYFSLTLKGSVVLGSFPQRPPSYLPKVCLVFCFVLFCFLKRKTGPVLPFWFLQVFHKV